MLGVVIGAAAGIAVGIVQASFFEWAFHRYWLHRPWLPKNVFTAHTLVHHQLCKHDDTFQVQTEEQHEALTFQWWGGPFLVFLNTVPYGIAAIVLGVNHVHLPWLPFLIAFPATVMLYYVGYEGFHFLMHKPTIAWIEKSRYFRFLEKHHRIHHNQMDRNLNVLLPLADLCLGTLVLEAPAVPTTPESALKLARRHSEFGRKLRDGESRTH